MSKAFLSLQPNRAQRVALYNLFARAYEGFAGDLVRHEVGTDGQGVRRFPNRSWRQLYRVWRERFTFTGFAGDYYLFGQPYPGYELWVGVERDGYTHS